MRPISKDSFRIKKLVRDFKENGIGYVRSPQVIKEIREYDPNLIIEYNRDEDIFKVIGVGQ